MTETNTHETFAFSLTVTIHKVTLKNTAKLHNENMSSANALLILEHLRMVFVKYIQEGFYEILSYNFKRNQNRDYHYINQL